MEPSEVSSGRAGVGPDSLSHSFYGLLEPRDVCTSATCHLAFTAPTSEGVVLEIFLNFFLIYRQSAVRLGADQYS
jgi:hypothetical protein